MQQDKGSNEPLVVIVSILAIVLLMAAILGNSAWQGGVLYDAVKDFQTLISAIIGFGALIMATLWGFRHSIESSEREAKKARELADELRNQEMRALAAALSAEFDVISNSITILHAQVERQQEDNEASPVALWKPTTEIFRKNTDRLGLLGARMARHVTNVSALADFASDTVMFNWTCLSSDQERADGIKMKIDDLAKEAKIISVQLEFVAEGHDPNDALDELTAEVVAEMLTPDEQTTTPEIGDDPDDE